MRPVDLQRGYKLIVSIGLFGVDFFLVENINILYYFGCISFQNIENLPPLCYECQS